MSTEPRPCKRCKGVGTSTIAGYFSAYSKQYVEPKTRECYSCHGAKTYAAPDVRAILAAIKGRNGLRTARPKDARAYYVWRMARFHGGKDVTMPVMAGLEIGGDPWEKELDAIAEIVALKLYGSHLAGSHRWGRALGILRQDVKGLPAMAYEGGPVADEFKPLEEWAELI